jgi:hypothetical protein
LIRLPSRILIAVSAILLGLFFCTIQDDNGNPAVPGPNNPLDNNPNGTVDTSIVPTIFASADSVYVRVGETLGVSITVYDDTSATRARPYNDALITVSRTHGWISDDSLRTDKNGRTMLRFADTTEGNRVITLTCNGIQSTVRVSVTNVPDQIQKFIEALPEKATITADGISFTYINVRVINEDHNPVVGEYVRFITSKGVIAGESPSKGAGGSGFSLTDENGVARAKLVSTAINDTAFITAYLATNKNMTDETQVAFQGVTIKLQTDSTNLRIGQQVLITAVLLGGSEEPIARSPIFFSRGRGAASNFSIQSGDTVTGFDGQARLFLSATATGTDSIVVIAAGARAVISLNVTDLNLQASVFPKVIQALRGDSATLSGTFTNRTGTPLSDKTIRVARVYKDPLGAAISDTLTGLTSKSGTFSFAIRSLAYDADMRMQITAFNNSTDLATADVFLQIFTTRRIIVQALPNLIQADGTSKSQISVLVKNDNNNPIVGDSVTFTTDVGLITRTAITDAEGKATVSLTSDRRNTVAHVIAMLSSNPKTTATVLVEFAGVMLAASANPPSINASGRDTSIVTARLADAQKNPIVGEPVSYKAQQPGTRIIDALNDSISLTDNRGEVRFKVFGNGAGTDTLQFDAANASCKVIVNYSSNKLSVSPSALTGQTNTFIANGIDKSRFLVTYLKGDGSTAIANARLEISITLGIIPGAADTVFADTMTTNSQGQAAFSMINPDFANTAVIFVTAHLGSEIATASYTQYFSADLIEYIQLRGSPDVIGINGDRAKITAIAFDKNGNRVKDAVISFNMLSGPGGGEHLDPATAITGADGSAVSYLISGATPSNHKDVWIAAGDFTRIKSDTARFTIAGPAEYITIRTNILEGENPKDGTFLLPCAAIVTDINGNPVADGTEVTFSLKVSGNVIYYPYVKDWYHGSGYDYGYGWLLDTIFRVIPFEDFNDNFRVDQGEDRNNDGVANRGEDVNGDGRFQPGPGFEDINGNGRRDYKFNLADYQTATSLGQDYPYQPAEAYTDLQYWVYDTLAARGHYEWRRVFADLNGNGKWDMAEPLLDPTITDAAYASLPGYSAAAGGFVDFDWNHNGVADPYTSVSITRTVQTIGGKATNKILYGQSDAARIEVMIWAESQGKVTKTPEKLILPIVK